MTSAEHETLKTAMKAHQAESARLQRELGKHAADLPQHQRAPVEALLKAHEMMSNWFTNDALACVPPTG